MIRNIQLTMADFDGYGENVTKYVDIMNRWPLLYHCTAYWYQQVGESDPYGPVGLEARCPRTPLTSLRDALG
jgi:hypothetical protein